MTEGRCDKSLISTIQGVGVAVSRNSEHSDQAPTELPLAKLLGCCIIDVSVNTEHEGAVTRPRIKQLLILAQSRSVKVPFAIKSSIRIPKLRQEYVGCNIRPVQALHIASYSDSATRYSATYTTSSHSLPRTTHSRTSASRTPLVPGSCTQFACSAVLRNQRPQYSKLVPRLPAQYEAHPAMAVIQGSDSHAVQNHTSNMKSLTSD